MQRLLAILLLLVLGLPSAAPVYAMQIAGEHVADAQLPACCRRDGQHHCSMSMAERRQALTYRVRTASAPFAPCPFCPRTLVVAAQGPLFVPPPAAAHHHAPAITTLRLRLRAAILSATSRAHNSRGPPALILD